MREVRYHPKASHEALESARFYDQKRSGLGMEFFSELDEAVQALQSEPLRPPPDTIGIRSWRLHRFPFRVYYIIESENIRILAVAHLRRKPGFWRQRIVE